MKKITILILCALALVVKAAAQQNSVGVFEGNDDVGNPVLKGNTVYNTADQTYLLSAAGKNCMGKTRPVSICMEKNKRRFYYKSNRTFYWQWCGRPSQTGCNGKR